MKKSTKTIIGISSSLVIIILAFYFIALVWLNGTLPEYEGEITVSGIKSDVKIYRDDHAIAYIVADDRLDAAFALGYVHAQERLFQMDLTRRAGEGRLSEVLGPATVPFDKMFRTIGLRASVVENLDKYNPGSMKLLKAYSDGINEFINSNAGHYQFEFDILDYDPYEWKPEHSLMISKLMAWELNMSWWSDIAYANLVQKLGYEKVAEIIPDYEENSPTIIPKLIDSAPKLSMDFLETDKAFRQFMGFTGTHIGSNNWVVSGAKSTTGKPIIANDPHLAFQVPGKWVSVVIKSPDWNVAGFTLPGAPVVVIGSNQKISWAMTNVMADDADFYLEKIDSTRSSYSLDGKWKPLVSVFDTISVKDSSDVVYKIERTHRGAIISDIHPYGELYPTEFNRADVSMRWSALEFSDELNAILKVNTSQNWKQFETALSGFSAPGQNFVFADDEGNIGYICAARLPLRISQSPTILFDGTTSESDWLGYVPYKEMPKLFNPKQNFIASANNKTVENFPYHISNIWEPSSRIDRITELLNSQEKHSPDDFEKYQMDFISKYAEKITPFILGAFESAEVHDKNLNTVLNLLKEWNFEMNSMSQTPAVYAVFFQKFLENIFKDEMSENLFHQYVFLANIPYRIVPTLLKNPYSEWFDDVSTEEVETRNQIIRKSLVEAIDELEGKLGINPADWQWGEVHQVVFKHLFSQSSDLMAMLLNVGPFPIGGDGTTVFNTEYSFNSPYENHLGPSMRYIYDFSNPGEMKMVLPTGQSGNFMSDHYSDFTDLWMNGRYWKIPLEKSAIENSGFSLLLLTK